MNALSDDELKTIYTLARLPHCLSMDGIKRVCKGASSLSLEVRENRKKIADLEKTLTERTRQLAAAERLLKKKTKAATPQP